MSERSTIQNLSVTAAATRRCSFLPLSPSLPLSELPFCLSVSLSVTSLLRHRMAKTCDGTAGHTPLEASQPERQGERRKGGREGGERERDTHLMSGQESNILDPFHRPLCASLCPLCFVCTSRIRTLCASLSALPLSLCPSFCSCCRSAIAASRPSESSSRARQWIFATTQSGGC